MGDAERIKILRDALEEVRKLTYQPYVRGNPDNQRPPTMGEKILAWAQIQSVAARALRDTDV